MIEEDQSEVAMETSSLSTSSAVPTSEEDSSTMKSEDPTRSLKVDSSATMKGEDQYINVNLLGWKINCLACKPTFYYNQVDPV